MVSLKYTINKVFSLVLILGALSSFSFGQPPSYVYQIARNFTAPGTSIVPPNTGNISGTGAAYHKLTWSTVGTVSTCSVRVDSSSDGVLWNTGDIIAATPCTTNGTVLSTSFVVNYVRINLVTLTGGGSLATVLNGYVSNPTTGTGLPGGSNTQVQFNDGGVFGGNSAFTFNKTSGIASSQYLATSQGPFINPKAAPYNCANDGSTDDTVCFQAAVTQMETSGGTIICSGSYKLDRIQFSGNDAIVGTGNTYNKGCNIFVKTDAAFVTAIPTQYLQNIVLDNLTFINGSNQVDFAKGNHIVIQNTLFFNHTGCGYTQVDGEQVFLSHNSSSQTGAGAGFALYCFTDPTKSLFSGVLTPGNYGIARATINTYITQGDGTTNYDQWLIWAGGTGSNGFSDGQLTGGHCFFSGHTGVLQLGDPVTPVQSAENETIDGLDLDHCGPSASPAGIGVNFSGTFTGSTFSHFNPGFNTNYYTTEFSVKGLNDSDIKNYRGNLSVNNTTTFGIVIGGGSSVGCIVDSQGGLFVNGANSVNTKNQICLDGSFMLPTNFGAGAIMSDVSNTGAEVTLMGNAANTASATSSFRILRFLSGGQPGTQQIDLSSSGSLLTLTEAIKLAEQAAPTGLTNFDFLWADSTAHRLLMNNNNVSSLDVVGIATAGTSGHCVQLAANGIDVVDSGTNNCGGGGSVNWNSINNPTGNQTLTMTGDSTTWNWGSTNTNQFLFDTTGNPTFGLVNATTAATNSPTITILGSYQNAGTPTFAADTWTLQNVIGAGLNGTSTLQISHTGTTGTRQISAPSFSSSTPTWTVGASGNGWGIDGSNNFIIYNGGNAHVASLNANGIGLASTAFVGWASSTSPTGTIDTGISRDSVSGVLDVGSGASTNSTGRVQAAGYISRGTKFTTNNGCTDSATAGGATAGTFTVGSTSCTEVVTMGNSAASPNGWSCTVVDITTLADVTNPHQTTSTATTATFVTGTVVSGDKIQFSCIGY